MLVVDALGPITGYLIDLSQHAGNPAPAQDRLHPVLRIEAALANRVEHKFGEPRLSIRIDGLRNAVEIEKALQLPARVVSHFITVRLAIAMLLDDHPTAFGDIFDVGV